MKRFPVALLTVLAAAIATVAVRAQQPDTTTIRQQLRESQSFERVIVTSYEPMQLADLVGGADLIVEASTMGGRAMLNATETDLYTDYPFDLHAIIKNSGRPDARVGDTVVVRRDCGMLVLDGRIAVSQENDFPLFDRDESYILFLVKARDGNAYRVFGGPQGAFSLREGVKQLSIELGDWTNKHGSVARAVFLDELRALMKFSS